MSELPRLAANDPSPLVRLSIASGLQRLLLDQRGPILMKLVQHAEDAMDQNLPLMLWYAAEPVIAAEPHLSGEPFIKAAKIPLLREYAARRIASSSPEVLMSLLADGSDELRLDVLRGMRAALFGQKMAKVPPTWAGIFKKLQQNTSKEVREELFQVGLIFDDPEAYRVLRKITTDSKEDASLRESSLRGLVQKHDPDTLPILFVLLTDKTMRGPALRGLAAYKDDKTPDKILEHYKTFTASEKADAINTLASRPAYAKALLTGLENGTIARTDVDTFIVRQLHGYKDKELSARLDKAWGTIRPVSQEKAAARWRSTKSC